MLHGISLIVIVPWPIVKYYGKLFYVYPLHHESVQYKVILALVAEPHLETTIIANK